MAELPGPTAPRDPAPDAHERAGALEPVPRDWRENARFAANIVNSLAVPLLTVAATVVGLYATNTLKEREIAIATENNSQALRNQREESETNLRSAMFRELVGPLLQSETEQVAKGADADLPRAQRLALLAELLALEFPRALRARPAAALRRHAARPDRGCPHAPAQHVAARDLAPARAIAVYGERHDGRNPAFLEISLNSDGTEPADKLFSCAAPCPSRPPGSGSHDDELARARRRVRRCASSRPTAATPCRSTCARSAGPRRRSASTPCCSVRTANRRHTRRRSSSRCRRIRFRSRTTRCCRAAIASAST